jgi:hypothetical protein
MFGKLAGQLLHMKEFEVTAVRGKWFEVNDLTNSATSPFPGILYFKG